MPFSWILVFGCREIVFATGTMKDIHVDRSIQLANLSDRELMQFRAAVEAEMAKRGVAYSVGDIGERLAIHFFNETRGLPSLTPAASGTKNVDALSREGERYSIKTLQKAKKTGTVYPDSNDPDRQLFEWILVVRLHTDYTLASIHRFSWDKFVELRRWDKRMNAWYLNPSSNVLSCGEALLDDRPD